MLGVFLAAAGIIAAFLTQNPAFDAMGSIVVGLLLVSGWWDRIVQWLQLQVVQGFTVPV